jgi:hypothetical protein
MADSDAGARHAGEAVCEGMGVGRPDGAWNFAIGQVHPGTARARTLAALAVDGSHFVCGPVGYRGYGLRR